MWEAIKRFFIKGHKNQPKLTEEFGYLRFTLSFKENVGWSPANIVMQNQHWPFKSMLIGIDYNRRLVACLGLSAAHPLHTLSSNVDESLFYPGLHYEGHVLLRGQVLSVYVNNLLVGELTLPPGSLSPKKPQRYIIQ